MGTWTTRAGRRPALWLGLLPAVLAGCESGSLPPKASPDQARAALTRALDDWQKGGPADALSRADPPVYFNDPRRKADVKLLAYKLNDAHEFYGQSVRIAAVLTFQFPDGAAKDQKFSYLIDTAPAVVIVPG